MNLLYFCIAALIAFLLPIVLFERKQYWSLVISGLGVAGVVNANFFHSQDYPIDIFGLKFGFDAIIYTLFVYTVILNFLYYGKKSAIIYTVSGAAAVLLAGLIEAVTKTLAFVSDIDTWRKFLGFLTSALLTIICGVAMVFILDILKRKHKVHNFFLVIIGLIFTTIINTLVYYTVTPMVIGYEFSLIPINTSFLGKGISIIFACGSYGLIMLVEKRVEKVKLQREQEESKE